MVLKSIVKVPNQKVTRRPKCFSVPFALKAVGQELDWMEAARVLECVSHSNWSAPIVPEPKKDGQIRICGDFKVMVNPVLRVDQYPLPKPEDLLTTLVGGKKFTKLYIKHAYQRCNWTKMSRN